MISATNNLLATCSVSVQLAEHFFEIHLDSLKLFCLMLVQYNMDATELQKENRLLKLKLEMLQQERHQHAEERKQHAQERQQHIAEIAQFTQALDDKQQQIERLHHRIKLLLQKVRGSRQERIDPDQLTLFSLEELEALAAELEQHPGDEPLLETEPSGRGKRRRGRKGKLPADLPREVIRHELSEGDRACPCCGDERIEIGEESSEQLEVIPMQFKVIENVRVKYACRRCQNEGTSGQVTIADKPPQPIEKGLPTAGLCAYTVLSKFGDHQPLYRFEDITSRCGYTIRRSTQCGWQAAMADLALSLVMRMKHLLLQSKVIHTDDTSIKLLEGKGVAHTAKFWPYVGDADHPYVVFDFTRTRERDGPAEFLRGFQGYLQADAYSGYDGIYAGKQVKEVACWVHARRYWHQASDNDPKRANQALSYIARLSQVEKQLRQTYPASDIQGHRDYESIAVARQEHSLPILESFKAWLDTESENKRILPKSPIRAAFTYTLNQWDALCRFTEAGFLSYDNNLAERMVKIPAIGRKNYLFVASHKGGCRAAIHYSLVSSAKANGVEPYAWLKDVFARLPYHRDGEAHQQATDGESVTSGELDYLLPDVWLKANPSHRWTIDEIRRAEREAKDV